MPELKIFPKHQVPREIACQIRSYIRIQWPFLNPHSGRVWDVEPSDAMTFVLMEDEMLVSHVEVKRRDFLHEGEMLKVHGLSTVFTYPSWRGSGCGRQIVQTATDYLRSGSADIGMLFCTEPRRMLYEGCGWIWMPSTKILEGPKQQPTVHGCTLMMLTMTDYGRELQKRFKGGEVYVGQTTW